ncbi:MAG: carboxypeptidase-like regulatory domain-containing protein [Bryobacteraceae bacterium]
MDGRVALVEALFLSIGPLWAQSGSLRIRVKDRTGAVIPGASVLLLEIDGRIVNTKTADDGSGIIWTNLPLGYLRVKVSAPAFHSRQLTVNIRPGVEESLEARLEVAPIEDVPDVDTVQMPYSETLDLAPVPLLPPTKPAKRRWWQIPFS